MPEEFKKVDSSSSVYKEFARLYRVVRDLRASSVDRWNGELYSRSDDVFGGVDPRTGSIRLSQQHVLDHLTGPGSAPSNAQAQALLTILHEAYHARTEIDAPQEPNAVRGRQSLALDEGLTERMATDDFRVFAQRCGYDGLTLDGHQYEGAVEAVDRLVDYAAGPDRQDELLRAMLDKPVVMRWEVVADEVVQNRLGDVVPQDPQHQQAARAELVHAMAHDGWVDVQHRSADGGRLVASDTEATLNAAVNRIRQHYQENPGQPYPSVAPNQAAETHLKGEQARGPEGLSQLPPPDPGTRVAHPSSPQITNPALRAALSGQAPAASATQNLPALTDGARGHSGAPNAPGQKVTTQTGRGER
jgi:hypothetical protein